ncbi:MAG: phosphatidate cytidylyltransferase, partial [Gammaproteobacteria bacterium]
MNLDQKLLVLFAGVGALLAFASLVGFVLGGRVASASGRETVENLNQRIRSWWVMVAIFGASFV